MKFSYLLLNVLLVSSVCSQNDDVNLERLSDYLAEGSDLARQGIQKLSQNVYETTIKKPIEAIASLNLQERLKPQRLFENMVQFVNKSVFAKRSLVELVTLKNNSNVTDDDAVMSSGTNGKMLSSVIKNENDYLLNQTNYTSVDNHSSSFHKTDFLFRKSHLTQQVSAKTTAEIPTSTSTQPIQIITSQAITNSTHLQTESLPLNTTELALNTNNEETLVTTSTVESIDLETSSRLTTVEANSSVSNEQTESSSTSTSNVAPSSSTVLTVNATFILTNPTNLVTSTIWVDSLESSQISTTNSSEVFTTLLSINETTTTYSSSVQPQTVDFKINEISTSTTEPPTTTTTTATMKATTSINLEANNKIKLKIVNYTLIDSNSSMSSSDSSASKSYSLRLHIKGYKWKEKFNNVSSLEAQEFLQRNILPLLYKNLNMSKDELNDIKLLRLFKENKNKSPE